MEFASKTCGCPELATEEWDLAERELGETVYFSTRLPMFFHIPLFATKAREKSLSLLRSAGFEEADPMEVLIRDGLFAGRLLTAVKNVSTDDNPKLVSLKGARVISKVVSGNRRDLSAGVSGLLSYVRTKAGTHPIAVYFWKIDCLRCGEENASTTVILAEI